MPSKTIGLQPIDWALIALYALSTIALGVYYSRKQQTTQEYFVGSGKMNPFFIGVSLFATLLSTISYLSMPGEALGKGPVTLVGMLALPLVYVVVAYLILPIYMKQRVTSAYELLEERLGLSLRLLGATMFLALRLVWMTLLVYLAAKAMSVMLGVDYWAIQLDEGTIEAARFGKTGVEMAGIYQFDGNLLRVASVPIIVLFTGLVSVIYTSLGGLQAVVITDFMQTILLFGGALLVLATVTWSFGGFGWFPTTWQSTWDTQPIFSVDPRTRVTVVGTILSIFVWYVATSGGDQTSVQRFMATTDANAARRAFATQLTVAVVVGVTLHIVGFALLSYFQVHRDELPPGAHIKHDADDLFPHYIAYQLPVGVSGLVVAAMFAAAMSSIDSGVNSVTAVIMTDYLDRFGLRPKTEKGHTLFARLLAFSLGVAVVFGSSFMKYIEGNITAVTNKTVNLLSTPIFALFFFALFFPKARALGVWIGAVCGTTVAILIAFSRNIFGPAEIVQIDQMTGKEIIVEVDPISFQWIGPTALLTNIIVGALACWIISAISPMESVKKKK